MPKIHSYFFILLLLISCSSKKVKENPETPNLSYDEFIPVLPGILEEISGIMIYDSLFWGFNDSGGKPVIYGFSQDGKIEREIEIKDARNRDWESITQDEKNIYIGDFGNNMGSRNNLRIYKVKKKDLNQKETQKVESISIKFTYADQNRFTFFDKTTPFDCEAMIEFEGNLYLFSKDWSGFTTRLYKLPKKNGEYELQPVDTFNVEGLITGADISPDKKKLALVGYVNFQSFIWLFENFEGDNFFDGDNTFYWLSGLSNAQTEGVCFSNNETILISCERTGAFREQVFRVSLKP